MKKDAKFFENFQVEFGNRVLAIRVELGLMQKDFAAKLNLTPQVISDYEKGRRKPGFDFFYHLVTVFNVDVLYLFTGKGNMFLKTPREGIDTVPDLFLGVQFDDRELEFQEYFIHSNVVKFQVLSNFNKLMLEERVIIEKEMKLKGLKKEPGKKDEEG